MAEEGGLGVVVQVLIRLEVGAIGSGRSAISSPEEISDSQALAAVRITGDSSASHRATATRSYCRARRKGFWGVRRQVYT